MEQIDKFDVEEDGLGLPNLKNEVTTPFGDDGSAGVAGFAEKVMGFIFIQHF